MQQMPEPPWRSAPKPARQPLRQELIVDTALSILDKEGLDAVSMRRVAQALDTGAASLYAHVRNKEELHELMLDRVLGEVELPEPDPEHWQEQLKELGRAQVGAMLAHPGIARIAMSTLVPTGVNSLRHAEAALALLRAGGLTERQAAFGFDALGLYCKAYALEVTAWSAGEFDEADIAERSRQVAEYMASLPPDVFPNMLAIGPLLSGETAEERFEFALDMLIGGLAALAAGGSG